MVSGISNSNENKQSRIIPTIAGCAVGTVIPLSQIKDIFTPVSIRDAKNTAKYMQEFMPDVDTFKNTQANIEKILTNTGLKEKGVKVFIHDGSKECDNQFCDMLNKLDPSKKRLNEISKNNLFNNMKYGANACYIDNNKTVIINNKNLFTSVYHELGHAMNANTNIFSKALSKARNYITPMGISILAPITLAIGLAHKVDRNKPIEKKDKVEKTLDFVADNAGTITLVSYTPLLAEEGLASIRGLNQAKKVLPKDKVSKLAKNYLKAWGTYAKVAAVTSALVGLGVMISNATKNNRSKEL